MKLNAERAEKIISKLVIPNQDTGSDTPFALYPEQRRLLQLLCQGKDTVILKSRQVGSSTLCLAYLLLNAISRPKTRYAIVAHDGTTAKKLAQDFRELLLQTGFKTLTDNQTHIKINNGSEVRVLTAGTTTSGRGFTYHMILCSEAAYYNNSINVMASLLKARFKGGSQVIFESTASAGDTHFRRSWEGQYYEKFFTGYEAHLNYRAPADTITDEQWNELKEALGFTSREAAAHWWLTLHKDSGGDYIRQIRECPLTPEQAFIAAEGRFIPIDPPIRPFAIDQQYPKLHLFAEAEPKGRYLMSIDTGAGIGADDSVIVVYDCLSRQIAALWVDNQTDLAGLQTVAKYIHNKYKTKYIIVESNGVGFGTYQGLSASNLPVIEYKASGTRKESNTYTAFSWAKDQIINHGLSADDRLVENCRSCQINTATQTGRTYFSGRKDIIAALSFIGANKDLITEIVNTPEPKVIGPNQFDMSAMIKATGKQRMMR